MIRVEQAHLKTVAITHPGMTGKNNEDKFGVSAYQLSDRDPSPVLLAVLSDGIGGHRAGEVASELAVNTISQHVAASDGKQPVRTLQEAIVAASTDIFHQSQAEGRQGMGATCAVVWISGNRLYTATIGDSRIYLMREHTIRQLNVDHTWIQEALENGLITPEQVEGHPNAHVIRRYLGSPDPPNVDFRLRLSGKGTHAQNEGNQGTLLYSGDRLLLCSDGLTDLVSDQEVLATFEQQSMENAIQTLVNLANQRGGHDNITLVAIEVPEGVGGVIPPAKARPLRLGCVVLLALLVLAGALGVGYLLYTGSLGTGATVTPALPSAVHTTRPTMTSPTVVKSPVMPAVVTIAVLPAITTLTPVTTGTRTPTVTHTLPPSATPTPTLTPTASETATTSPTATLITVPPAVKTP